MVARGFSVCYELTGHGIGRRIHEPPTVANVFDAAASEPLTPGLVITVEPIIAAGRGAVSGCPTAGRSHRRRLAGRARRAHDRGHRRRAIVLTA